MSKISSLLLAAILFAMPRAAPALEPAAQTTPVIVDDPRAVDIVTISSGKVTIGGKILPYTANIGGLVIRRQDGSPYHRISYTAYTLDGRQSADRPITFVWNGGPGGTSVWLHMAALGPRRLRLAVMGSVGAAPYRLVNNPYCLLDQTDLVFIDAPFSGFSSPVGDGKISDIAGLDKDALAFTRFIERYISVYERWNSPKFLVGASYGTARAAVVAGMLQQNNIELNGVVFVSSMLDMNNIAINFPSEGKGPDEWYVLTLPTFATAAYAAGKAGFGQSLAAWAERARRFAGGPYAAALREGDELPEATRAAIIAQISQLIGIAPNVVRNSDLRISAFQFRKELLRDRGLIVGRYDARVQGVDRDSAGDVPGYDPALALHNGAFIAAFMTYAATELGLKHPEPYVFSAPLDLQNGWQWEHQPHFGGSGNLASMRTSSVAADIGAVSRQNPNLRIFFANGLFDLATPFFQAEYGAAHLGLGDRYHEVVRFKNYAGGHMFYIDEEVLHSFRDDLRKFYIDALNANRR